MAGKPAPLCLRCDRDLNVLGPANSLLRLEPGVAVSPLGRNSDRLTSRNGPGSQYLYALAVFGYHPFGIVSLIHKFMPRQFVGETLHCSIVRRAIWMVAGRQ